MDGSTDSASHISGHLTLGTVHSLSSPRKQGLLQGRYNTTAMHSLTPLRTQTMGRSGTGSGSDLEHQGASGDWAAPGDQPLISSCFQLVDSTCFDIAVMSSDELAHFWFNFVMHEQSLGCWKSASTRRHVRERAG